MVILNLPKLTRLRPKVDLSSSKEALLEKRHRKGPVVTIYDLKRAYEERKQKELVIKTNPLVKSTEELLNKMRLQQIELFKSGLCPRCKEVV